MQMYSREEMMEEMAKHQSMKDEDDSDNSTTERASGELSIWDTIVHILNDILNWIRQLLGVQNNVSGEL